MRTVSEKLGVKPGSRTYITGAPDDALNALLLPALSRTNELQGQYSYLHLFVRTGEQMNAQFPVLRRHLAAAGMLWVSWPRGSNTLQTFPYLK